MVEQTVAIEGTNPDEFCPIRWVRMISDLAKDPAHLKTVDYSAMLYETTNLFKKMGSAMSMAFSGKRD